MKSVQERIDDAIKECRKAFAAYPGSGFVWCCHHELLLEWSSGVRSEERINYILWAKPRAEQVIRFKNFRPCTQQKRLKAFQEAYTQKVANMWMSITSQFMICGKNTKEK